MKRILKNAVCVLLILFCVLYLVAKYDACGVRLGPYNGRLSYFVDVSGGAIPDISKVLQSTSGYYLYTNRFGRVVVAEGIRGEPHYRNFLTNAVYEKCGRMITQVQTVQPGIPTHLDFVGADNGSTTVFELVARAGMPSTDVATPEPYEFTWVTVDGCWYHVGLDINSPIVKILSVSYPGYTETTEAFQTQVVVFYLALAAALSGVLVCLLAIPKRIEKRKKKV